MEVVLPHSRVAVSPMKGYFYQIDHYILQLLRLSNTTDSVRIEGIEDVDITMADETTAIQCKYYAGTEYNHSVIAKPICLMLKHFLDKQNESNDGFKYVLYGYYKSGQNKLPDTIDLLFFRKNFMTSSTRKLFGSLDIQDDQINKFVNSLTININALSYEEQERQVIDMLKKQFNCSDFEAEYCYYSNALYEVRTLATNTNESMRDITKADFLSKINKKDILLNSWLREKKGIEKYCKTIRKEFFSHFNISPYERFFLIDCDSLITDIEIKTVIMEISKNWSKLSKREKNTFCPYVFLHNIAVERLVCIKKLLQSDNVTFLDGHDFDGADFSVKSILKRAAHTNNISLKIINKKEYIDNILEAGETTREIYQFFFNKPYYEDDRHKHIKISVARTTDIGKII
jgi:hypothetical protein